MAKVALCQEEISIPKAVYKGSMILGSYSLDCYVLDNGERVISQSATIKAISGDIGGDLKKYLVNDSVKKNIFSFKQPAHFEAKSEYNSLNLKENQHAHLDKKENLISVTEFFIPEIKTIGKGVSSSDFVLICKSYNKALYEGSKLTSKQRGVSVNCSKILEALATVGLDALIDEVTGFQEIRSKTALQDSFSIYLAQYTRRWEKTFPDQLWLEFARLTNFKGCPFTERPGYWGTLVTQLIYYAWNPDLAKHLQKNKPEDGKWHQNLSKEIGVRALQDHCNQIVGVAKICNSMKELKDLVSQRFIIHSKSA